MSEHERPTDPAALAATALAGALSVFLAPGPYGYLSLVIGFTLLALLIGYEWRKPRDFLQSIAFSTVISLCAMLVFGVCIEFLSSGQGFNGFINSDGDFESRVSELRLFEFWSLFSVFAFTLDRYFNKSRLRANKSQERTE